MSNNFRNDIAQQVPVKFWWYINIGKSHITTRTPFCITSNGLEYMSFHHFENLYVMKTRVQSYPFIYAKLEWRSVCVPLKGVEL